MSPAPAAPPARRHRAARSAGGAGRICLPHPRWRCRQAVGHHRQRARPGRPLHERGYMNAMVGAGSPSPMVDGGASSSDVRRPPLTLPPSPLLRSATLTPRAAVCAAEGAGPTRRCSRQLARGPDSRARTRPRSLLPPATVAPTRCAARPSPLAPPLARPSSTARWRCRGSDTCALLFQTRNFAGNPAPVSRSTVRAVFAAAPARATPLERLRANFVVPDSAFFPRIN